MPTESLTRQIEESISRLGPDRVLALTDSNVRDAVAIDWNIFDSVKAVEAGESSKSLDRAVGIWEWLIKEGATRKSVLVNVGGGMVTDLGGFAASLFKRGIRHVNVPTTLLAIADASIGGKTGVDFCGLKNEIGTFAPAAEVIVCPDVLDTLPDRELLSGFAEVVKMAILTDKTIYESLLTEDSVHNRELLTRAMRHAASEKMRIVKEDPYDRGLRRILNFGHTAGHAYESYAMQIGRPISHGEAVAHGMGVALELSHERIGLPAADVAEYREKILERYYPPLPFGREADDEITALMKHDKKNSGEGEINYILIPEIGFYGENE